MYLWTPRLVFHCVSCFLSSLPQPDSAIITHRQSYFKLPVLEYGRSRGLTQLLTRSDEAPGLNSGGPAGGGRPRMGQDNGFQWVPWSESIPAVTHLLWFTPTLMSAVFISLEESPEVWWHDATRHSFIKSKVVSHWCDVALSLRYPFLLLSIQFKGNVRVGFDEKVLFSGYDINEVRGKLLFLCTGSRSLSDLFVPTVQRPSCPRCHCSVASYVDFSPLALHTIWFNNSSMNHSPSFYARNFWLKQILQPAKLILASFNLRETRWGRTGTTVRHFMMGSLFQQRGCNKHAHQI